MSLPASTSPRALSLRYAGFYGAVFFTLGVYLPFWPVWLAGRGLGAEEIGLLFALAAWTKVVTTPAIAQAADRSGRGKTALVVLAGLSLLVFAAFIPARGFWPILIVMLFAAASFHGLIPLGESLTMSAVTRARLDYGRIRLWGSIAFVLGSLGAGAFLTGRDPDLVLWLILGALGLTLLATAAMPGQDRPPAPAERRGMLSLLGERRFVIFLAAASLLQASHAVYYGFSALHWKAAGHSEITIGLLWAEGVVAEIVLFAAGGAAVARAGPAALLAVAGLGGLVRWTLLGLSTALPVLLAGQVLHAATFGAAHLGAMHFIARNAPPGLSATAQGLYAALAGGVAMGLALLAAGWLYDAYQGNAFFAMLGLSAGGLLLAVMLQRQSQ